MKMTIEGAWVDASTGDVSDVRNPGTGAVIDTVPDASTQDVQRALEAARDASAVMARVPAYRRAELLARAAALMHADLERMARLLAEENGKPLAQTEEELRAAIRIFRGFAEEAKRVDGAVVPMDAVQGMHRHFAFEVRQPVGIVVAIVPFNYPVELYAHKGAAALAAGNAVICKPPPQCPLTLLALAEHLERAGVPAGAHQVVTGGDAVGEQLVSSDMVDLISATGSVAMGQRVSALAAANVTPVHLELGGNDALIVCDDADLAPAVDAVVLGRLARGNGQICCATKRVLVAAPRYDEFSGRLADRAGSLVVGDQLDPRTEVGPLIDEPAAQRVEEAVAASIAAGATVAAGGRRSGAFHDPTVLTEVPDDAPVVTEEVFGPVAPVLAFDDLEEALARANSSPYGLQAGVFTNDIGRALSIAHRLDVGGVVVNWSSAVRVESLPFGGIKRSGHGREGLRDTLRTMTRQKTVLVHDGLRGVFDD